MHEEPGHSRQVVVRLNGVSVVQTTEGAFVANNSTNVKTPDYRAVPPSMAGNNITTVKRS
ncbi:hypothetical protein [Couchioplanes caeruleus]|uniref:Uncharacterized protein n=1 Tax=Couchioplanes caeruleus subsp. caeruleus TaxID=56427 RepID=A0A1K0GBA3_9ACTN|nr:hypothetical protein [Couchioplanes caeruleus]OJF14522.1 hypothetical protein BG844_09315 [Couchioplanes caeruleus subsp. caeruleus]